MINIVIEMRNLSVQEAIDVLSPIVKNRQDMMDIMGVQETLDLKPTPVPRKKIKKKQKPGRVRRKRWTDYDNKRLRGLIDGGLKVSAIADALGRTTQAIYHQKSKFFVLLKDIIS